MIEAAAHATPVVSTNVGSIPDAIVQDETGFLVEVGDTEGFASAVLRLLRDPVLRSSMGTSARGRTQERFGLEGVISGFETLYRDLLNGQRV